MTAIQARAVLYESARTLCEWMSFNDWRETALPEALAAVSDREIDAFYGMFWEPRPRRRGAR